MSTATPPSPPQVRISPEGGRDGVTSPSDPRPPSDLPLPLWQVAMDTVEGWVKERSSHTLLEGFILLVAGLALGLAAGGNAKLSFLLFGLPPLALGALIWFATTKTDALTSTPVGDPDPYKHTKDRIHDDYAASSATSAASSSLSRSPSTSKSTRYVAPVKTGTLIARRTMEEHPNASSASSTISSTIAPYLSKARGGAAAAAGGAPQLPPEQYYAKLSGDTLYLHKTMDFADSQAIGISLSGHEVALWPENTPDAELFAKRNCIKIYRSARGPSSASSSTTSLQDSVASAAAAEDGMPTRKATLAPMGGGLLHSAPWYFFIKSNTEMEDWYLALKHAASPRREEDPISLLAPVFSQPDMRQLREAIDSEPDPIPMRWLNAMFGRIFLGVNRTQWLQDFITTKIQKKLSRVELSPKLSPLIVTAVSFSSPPPSFSTPILKNLSEDGEAAMEVKLAYKGEVSISVSTTVTIQLPFAKEPRTWPMGLTISVKELEGDLIVMVKKPPSARIWYGFREMPKVTISVVPMFSTLQISWKVLLAPIENQLKEIIAETVVWPNMDDIPWFDTTAFTRGGIFADAVRKETVDGRPAPTPDVPSEVLLENLIETTESLPTNANNLRKRNGTAASTDSLDPSTIGLGIKRVETAPPQIEKTSSASSYRGWLTGGARKSSSSSTDVASLPPTVAGGSSLKTEPSLARSSASVASVDSASSTLGADAGGGDLTRTSSAGSARSIPTPSERSISSRAGHQSTRSTSSIPATSSDASSAPSTSPTTTMSILGNLRDKKSREEALAKGISFAKGFQGMKEARSLWNRKVGDKSAATPTETPVAREDESWHQRYVAEEPTSSEPSLYSGSLSSRSGKTAEPTATGVSTTPPKSDMAATVPMAPSPLHGRARADSASSKSSRPKAPYIDPYAAVPSKPSVSATTVTASSSSPPKPVDARPPSIHRSHGSHTSGSSIIAAPAPSIATTQLNIDALPPSDPAATPAPRPTRMSFSSPSQADDRDANSASSAPTVRTQLPRSKMMSVPAIPKDRKAEQMSFGSTPPREEPVPELSESAGTRTHRLGSSIYQLVAGSPKVADRTSPDVPAAPVFVDTPESERVDPHEALAPATVVPKGPPPLPSRPTTPALPPPTADFVAPSAPQAIITASSPLAPSISSSPPATAAENALMSIAHLDRERSPAPLSQVSSPSRALPPTLPPRRSVDEGRPVAPALPPRSPSQQAPKELESEGETRRGREREEEVKPAQIRSRSDSEDASGRELFPYEP